LETLNWSFKEELLEIRGRETIQVAGLGEYTISYLVKDVCCLTGVEDCKESRDRWSKDYCLRYHYLGEYILVTCYQGNYISKTIRSNWTIW
jgi:hypothetical protein